MTYENLVYRDDSFKECIGIIDKSKKNNNTSQKL